MDIYECVVRIKSAEICTVVGQVPSYNPGPSVSTAEIRKSFSRFDCGPASKASTRVLQN